MEITIRFFNYLFNITYELLMNIFILCLVTLDRRGAKVSVALFLWVNRGTPKRRWRATFASIDCQERVVGRIARWRGLTAPGNSSKSASPIPSTPIPDGTARPPL